MASTSLKLGVLLVISTAVPAALAASGDLAPSSDCSNLILRMTDCLSFVSKGSTLQKPLGNCCGGLLTIVETDPWCLCEGLHNSAKQGIVLDFAKTKAFPPLCKVPSYIIPNCVATPPAEAPTADATASKSTATVTKPAAPTLASPATAPAHGTSAASSLVAVSSLAVSVAAAATGSWFLI